ncbi:bacteriohemerythrin [Fusibacter sp. 3D3]|uniref:bacteriohemerythrin n=1 Tax=Fusibacter sp. 3D3 TaxID=1048380 RepID=UPI00085344C5|nr:hemerythrin family protein [Fusibacter sp. 3D3]GAU79384.1 hemerythrin-like iron-binding protein [Fusibacter sp. 3D3]
MIWDESLAVGNEIIDHQHQQLFSIATQLETLFEAYSETDDNYDEIIRILIKLHLYTMKHFEAEEKILEAVDFPGLAMHKKEHQRFILFLERIKVEAIETDRYQTLLDLLAYVVNWIMSHVKGTDSAYVPYLPCEVKL